MTANILMIVTSNARMGDSGKATGIWAEELATPYLELVDAGARITFASPAGGQVPFDPASLKPAGQNHRSVERLLADEGIGRELAATRRTDDIDPSEFDAVFLPGGHGAMWDLPDDAGAIRAIKAIYGAGRPVAAVCHGVAGLVSTRRSDGEPLVKGLRINSFTDAEERAAELDKVVPFMLETRLRELGGRFENAPNWQPYAVRDGMLITGQNPQSSSLVARELLAALGLNPGA